MAAQTALPPSGGRACEWHLWAQVLVCPLGIGRKVAETMPMVQRSPPGQAVKSGLLGLHKQESMADSYHNTQKYF